MGVDIKGRALAGLDVREQRLAAHNPSVVVVAGRVPEPALQFVMGDQALACRVRYRRERGALPCLDILPNPVRWKIGLHGANRLVESVQFVLLRLGG